MQPFENMFSNTIELRRGIAMSDLSTTLGNGLIIQRSGHGCLQAVRRLQRNDETEG